MELKKFFGQHIEPFNGQQSIAMTQYTVNTSLHIHYTSSLSFVYNVDKESKMSH